MRRMLTAAAIAAVLAVALPAAAGGAADTIRVRIPEKAQLVDGGIRVSVAIWCVPTGDAPFETNVTVTQDDGAIWAQRSLPFVPCDRRWHTVTVVATPFDDARFHRGPAFVSAYVSRVDEETGDTRQGQATRVVRVR
ncbi:MAG TPA: hypothetical protein VHF89_05145 [Solirubrobacteraceae bacterium]|nr:hypothetical protein [Solirubrobacteraceae bacterium]